MVSERVKEDNRTLRIVSPAYAGREGELTSVLQYVYQAIYLGERGEKKISSLLMEIASCEMRHLQIVGTLITKLGAPPLFAACPPYPVSYYSASCVNYTQDMGEMLLADLLLERASVAAYTKMEGGLENPARETVSALLQEEKEHCRLLESVI